MLTPKQIGLLRAFAEAGVEVVIVGGVAVNAHGYQRTTVDLDLFFRPTEDAARAAFRALQNLGIPLHGIEPIDLLDDEENLRFGSLEDQVDLLASIGEIPFDQVWRNRLEVDLGEITVSFISREDLIRNKREIGRAIDLADVEALERIAELAR